RKALDFASLRSKCWFQYVDDTLIIWSHELDIVEEFQQHLNGVHTDIKFIIADGTLGHMVYRKPSYTLSELTDSMLTLTTTHRNKAFSIHCFIWHVTLSNLNELDDELDHLRTAYSCYNDTHPRESNERSGEDPMPGRKKDLWWAYTYH
ncbi:hypothetical protein NQ315_014181, partial [Exocentrus adspersus]